MNEPRVLVISGSMGAGKTTVLGEASDLLSAREVVHAAFDLDALGLILLPERQSRELHYRNLATIYQNCRDAGINHFLIAAAIESKEVLSDLTRAVGNAAVRVCRLTASLDTMANRLRMREVGFRQPDYLDRSRVLDSILDAAGVEDFQVANDGQNVITVATEMLVRANWITVN
jgi:ribose 1,5-bisphosphokinase PhnN